MISRIIASFQNDHSDVVFEQSYGNLTEVGNGLRADQLDIGVVPLGTSGEPDGLSFTPILTARNVVCCRVGHPLQRTKRLSTGDLGQFPWVAPLPGSPLLADLFAIRLALREHVGVDVANRHELRTGQLVAVIHHVPAALGVDADDRDADVSVCAALGGNLSIEPGITGEEGGATADE